MDFGLGLVYEEIYKMIFPPNASVDQSSYGNMSITKDNW
jgi:hypothetical protein